jgi:UDP:flavonoid glycosyltransferase YjiC (YdhE family)
MEDSQDYGSPVNEDAGVERLTRRLFSIRSSLSYRLGNLIVNSVLKPWKLLILPISMPLLLWNFGQEKIGRKKTLEFHSSDITGVATRECVVLFPTNGVGMGHYARMYALASAIRKMKPEVEIVFFTTNYVLHPLYSEGMTCYHLPSRKKFKGMGARTWNQQCEEMLANVFSVHKPSVFIFDGAYPYRGMLNAIKNRISTTRIWVKRINRRGKENAPVDSYAHFDKIVVPGDLIEADMEEMAKLPIDEIVMTPPMLSVSRSDLNERGHLRSRLGIPPEGNVALVSLGAGEINDISNLRDFVIEGLVDRGIFVIIADSMLKPMKKRYDHEKIRVVQSFPIMRNRSCFDFAVIAGGYNSVNECILLRLPSVIIPNFETSRDDQPGRAEKASETGGAIVVEKADKGIIGLALDRICDDDVRAEMAQRLVMNYADDGAEKLAVSIISSI